MKVLEAKWSAEEGGGSVTFEQVALEEPVRGVRVWYKAVDRGVFDMDVSVDGAVAAVIAIAGTAYFNELESVWAEVPEIGAGVHDLTFSCGENGYFDRFELTQESPCAGAEEAPVRHFRDTCNDLLVATDMLGRKLPGHEEAGGPKRKLVGLFYWTWRNGQGAGGRAIPRNLTKILERAPEAEFDMGHPIWTDNDLVHWNEPFYGFYRNDDPYVIRKHAQYFADAGVDVLVFDATNGSCVWRDAYMPLLEGLDQARRDGIRTPQVAFMMNFAACPTTLAMLRSVYQDLYRPGRYRDLWFLWEGKPLVMAYPESIPREGKSPYDTQILNEIRAFFTFRPGQPGYATGPKRPDHWGWLETAPQNGFGAREDGSFEMCTVGVAQNARDGRICTHFNDKGTYGRSYTHEHGHGRLTEDSYLYGLNVQEQWERALELDPDYVFVTGWNEWLMGKFPGKPWIWDEDSTQIAFVDQYDREHSRDIEPDCDGYLDSYYLQLCANIRRFKGVAHVDRDVAPIELMPGEIEKLREALPAYLSHAGTEAKRDCQGLGKADRYVNHSGRNNIVEARVAYDSGKVHFLAICREEILPAPTGAVNPMTLLLDTDCDKATGWEGYDFKITEGVLYGWRDGAFREIGGVEAVRRGNALMLTVDRELLGLAGEGKPVFEFKWIDSIALDDVMNFYRDGDAAPFGRFNFIY